MQNTSHAVMSQRHEAGDSLDFFPTPPWATRALCEWLATRHPIDKQIAADPACGAGDMVRPLSEFFRRVDAFDVYDHGHPGVVLRDYLTGPRPQADWIITNPPFNLAARFVVQALEDCAVGCALLVRTAFLEGVKRFTELFSPMPPAAVLQFVERVPMHKGRLVKDGSTATAYCWIVWTKQHCGQTNMLWIAPCRRRLERDSDYWWREYCRDLHVLMLTSHDKPLIVRTAANRAAPCNPHDMKVPMFTFTVQAATAEEFAEKMKAASSLFGSVSAAAVETASATEGAKAGKGKAGKSSDPAQSEAPKTSTSKKGDSSTKRAVGSTAAVEEPSEEAEESTDDDVLGASSDETATEWTVEDVRKYLVDVKNALPNEQNIVSKLVKEHGKAAKLTEVDEGNFGAIIDACKKLLSKAGK